MERYLLPAAAGFLAALGGAVAKCAVDADNRGCLDKFGISPDECPIWVDALNLSCDTVRFAAAAALNRAYRVESDSFVKY